MHIKPAEHLQQLPAFSFPAIFEGRGTIVTVNKEDAVYGVSIDDTPLAHLKMETDFNRWLVVNGSLNDDDLVKEIGDRIVAKYH